MNYEMWGRWSWIRRLETQRIQGVSWHVDASSSVYIKETAVEDMGLYFHTSSSFSCHTQLKICTKTTHNRRRNYVYTSLHNHLPHNTDYIISLCVKSAVKKAYILPSEEDKTTFCMYWHILHLSFPGIASYFARYLANHLLLSPNRSKSKLQESPAQGFHPYMLSKSLMVLIRSD
jgi:hypothetical protein